MALGLVVSECLERVGVKNLSLKWPNDILVSGGKVAGILVEILNAHSKNKYVVIGIGINIYNEVDIKKQVQKPIADLVSMLEFSFDRTALLASIIIQISAMLRSLSEGGFSNYVHKWNKRDAYMNNEVVNTAGEKKVWGIGLGIDSNGAYCVRDKEGYIHKLISGELRLL